VKSSSTAHFLTPLLLGAKAYLLRMILHDYSDATAVEILRQIIPAMEPDSVVLVADYILPERVTDKDLRIVSVRPQHSCFVVKQRLT
jgi:hypothetical protein